MCLVYYFYMSGVYQSVANWYKSVAVLICIILNNKCHEQVNMCISTAQDIFIINEQICNCTLSNYHTYMVCVH